jgi:hypothetical protein
MSTSTYFLDLQSVYQSELDDLTSDSEGKDVLRKRLAEKRKELGFLLKMIEISPEMVVVVLHQAFRFTSPAVMEQLLACESDDLPQWASLSDGIEIAPWARDMVQSILKEPMGEWFMTIACALEYMHNKPLTAAERAQLAGPEEDEEDLDEVRNERHDDNHTEDHDEDEAEARAREEAGNDWMVEQGFDRKE